MGLVEAEFQERRWRMKIDAFVRKWMVRRCRDNQLVKDTLWMLMRGSKCVCVWVLGELAECPEGERGSECVRKLS